MSLPKNSAASSMVYGIVVGGDENDPDPGQAGGLRVYFPTIHGKGVKPEHLAFSPRLVSPTRSGMQEFVGGIDTGSLVLALKDTGSNQCQIIGLASDLNNRDSNIPGNNDLLEHIAKFFTRPTGVNRPPNIVKSSSGGAEVYTITERGSHFHDLLKGLPTHGALFPLAGTPIEAIKNIRTAIQAAASIPGLDVINSLPGVPASLGSLLNNITSNPALNKLLTSALPRDVLNTIKSMSNLVQSVEQGESIGFMTASRVNPEIYTQNAIKLLGQCTNISDVTTAMTRLQSDSSLFGMESYGPTIVKQVTPYGEIQQIYNNANGTQLTVTPASIISAVSTVQSLISGGGFPSAIPGIPLFGSSAGTMFNMMQRLPSSQMASAMAMLTLLNTSGAAVKIEAALKSPNPINTLLG